MTAWHFGLLEFSSCLEMSSGIGMKSGSAADKIIIFYILNLVDGEKWGALVCGSIQAVRERERVYVPVS